MKELLETELSHEFHCTLTATCHGKPNGKFVRHRLRLLHRWNQMHSECAGAVGGGRAGGVGAAPSVSLDASGSVAACGLGSFRLASARCEAKIPFLIAEIQIVAVIFAAAAAPTFS